MARCLLFPSISQRVFNYRSLFQIGVKLPYEEKAITIEHPEIRITKKHFHAKLSPSNIWEAIFLNMLL